MERQQKKVDNRLKKEDMLLKPKAVAEMLDLSLQTIYRMSSENLIPKLKIGGSLRFRQSEILEWIDSINRKKPTSVNRSII